MAPAQGARPPAQIWHFLGPRPKRALWPPLFGPPSKRSASKANATRSARHSCHLLKCRHAYRHCSRPGPFTPAAMLSSSLLMAAVLLVLVAGQANRLCETCRCAQPPSGGGLKGRASFDARAFFANCQFTLVCERDPPDGSLELLPFFKAAYIRRPPDNFKWFLSRFLGRRLGAAYLGAAGLASGYSLATAIGASSGCSHSARTPRPLVFANAVPKAPPC